MDERAWILGEFANARSFDSVLPAHDYRYGALALLAWLLTEWPDSQGAKIARVMIGRRFPQEGDWVSFHPARRGAGSERDEADSIIPATRHKLGSVYERAGEADSRWLNPGSLLLQSESSAAELF